MLVRGNKLVSKNPKRSAQRLPLRVMTADQLQQDLSIHESLDIDVVAGVASQRTLGLAGVTETEGHVRTLQFLVPGGWIVDIPVADALVNQLRRIVGSFEVPQ